MSGGSFLEVAMENRKAVTDELAYKVNYVRDWLNKAEAAIQRGDTIDAIAKLSLAKADTTNIISALVPQAMEYRRPQPVRAPSFALRRLALLAAPLVLIGCFLFGLAVGGMSPSAGYNTLKGPLAGDAVRSVERPSLHGDMTGLVANVIRPSAGAVKEDDSEFTDSVRKAVARRVAKATTPAKASDTGGEEVVEVMEGSDGTPEVVSAEEPLDLFDFGLDVIRSARQNMGR